MDDDKQWHSLEKDDQQLNDDKKLHENKSNDAADHQVIDSKTINNLSKGLLSLYMTDLEQVSLSLVELKQNQNILIETIQQENEKYQQSHNTFNLNEMLLRLKAYHCKLLNIKKEMKIIQEKSQKLKQRAKRLQSQKEAENKQKEIQRNLDLAKELQILAKPIPSKAPAMQTTLP